ncbi:MAG: hypothetical protein K2K91_04920 [Ruminococcus sp.]|nr:hypothetical protein [Ruminococcus sp.]
MGVIYNIMIGDFFQLFMRIRRRRSHYHHSSESMSLPELVLCIIGVSLIHIAFKTSLIEKITSNELIRTILKIVFTLIGIAIIISSFVIDSK